MAEERDSLRAEAEGLRREVERLRGEVERLQGEHASLGDERLALENTANECRRRWEAELLAARAEADRHAAMVRDRDADLATALGERDRLRTEREDTSAEVERLRATVAQLEREQQERPGRTATSSSGSGPRSIRSVSRPIGWRRSSAIAIRISRWPSGSGTAPRPRRKRQGWKPRSCGRPSRNSSGCISTGANTTRPDSNDFARRLPSSARIDQCATSHTAPPAGVGVGADQARIESLQTDLADVSRLARRDERDSGGDRHSLPGALRVCSGGEGFRRASVPASRLSWHSRLGRSLALSLREQPVTASSSRTSAIARRLFRPRAALQRPTVELHAEENIRRDRANEAPGCTKTSISCICVRSLREAGR